MSFLFKSREFVSTLTVDECVLRLKENLGSPFSIFSKFGFSGSVVGRHVSIRKNIAYRNSWQTVFVGHLSGFGSETWLRGTFRINAFVIIFMLVWFGGVGCAALAILSQRSISPAALVPIAMLGFGTALTRFGRYLARNEQADISRFLCATLEAQQRDNAN